MDILKNTKIQQRGRKKETYLLFIYFKRTFDSVDRKYLTNILYKKDRLGLEIEPRQEAPSPVEDLLRRQNILLARKGVPQGFAPSPLLFTTYLNELLKSKGIFRHQILAYADDIVVVCHSIEEL